MLSTAAEKMEDWATYTYEEQGARFHVAERRDQKFKNAISESGPLSSLNRDGRYLLPYTEVLGEAVFHSQTEQLLEKQRKLLRFCDMTWW